MAQGIDIGIPRERKPEERRVALVPEAVGELVRNGHRVRVESGAGEGSGFADDAYRSAGAEMVAGTGELYAESRLILKVKEPIPEEYGHFRGDHVLFSFLHLAAVPDLAAFLRERGVTAFAFETLDDGTGHLPLLAPMSAIAGKVAAQNALTLLHAPRGGRGLLLGGAPGTERGRVVVLGAGGVGGNAAALLSAAGARVDVLDLDVDRAEHLAAYGPGQISGLYPYRDTVADLVAGADVVIGAVLSAGARAPTVVTRDQVAAMSPGSVIADVAVDQGGCIETTRPTDYTHPTYTEAGVIHFAVTNMPAAVPRTATKALSARLLPYAQKLARMPFEDLEGALQKAPDMDSALNVVRGGIHHQAVAASLAQ
ncbi:alanine dehydrogenase [Thiohalorhabdus methylotrophus]|uniref:alanine dehydrogenase n=1 Tax=Thiohalorhabdus methylotrophus TaxID=3242694 RepID=A0ABV4TXC3_9GAMM